MKTAFSSRDVVALTGITPRQLQWWDEQGIVVPPWAEVDLAPLLLPEEQRIIKQLLKPAAHEVCLAILPDCEPT